VELKCARCGRTTSDLAQGRTTCSFCGGYWELSYPSKVVFRPWSRGEGLQTFAESLPPIPVTSPSLGEGNTPLIDLSSDGLDLHRDIHIMIKNETMNPTGSFKDRFSVVNSAVARNLGAPGIVCASTGNAAMAAVAYAHANALESAVMLPYSTPQTLVDILKVMGAEVDFCSWEDSSEAIRPYVDKGWFPATGMTAFPVATQFGAEGYKTIAYEIIRDLQEGIPDVIAIPVGGGDLLYGMIKGLCELRDQGLIPRIPHILACQADLAAPLVQAYAQGLKEVRPIDTAGSMAKSINETSTGQHALDALRKVDGWSISVSEEEIMNAATFLTHRGILAELASSASLAGVIKAVRDTVIVDQTRIVCIITGSLLKWNDALMRLAERAEKS
jgi:threonine synthase